MINSESVIERLKKKKIKLGEVYIFKGKSFLAEIRNQDIETSKHADITGVGIRVIIDSKLGFAYSTSLTNKENIEETIDRAIINSRNNTPDEFNTLPMPGDSPNSGTAPIALHIFDSKYDGLSVEQKIEKAKESEIIARNFDSRIKDVRHSLYQDIFYEISLVNTLGINCNYQGTSYSLSLLALASDGTDSEIAGDAIQTRFFDELNPGEVGKFAAEKSIKLLGACSISPRVIDLIINPMIGCEILGSISAMLSAEVVAKGKSLFKNKTGEKVASPLITIIDDGTIDKGLGTSPFDGEGVQTQKNVLIENGKLINFMYNTYSSYKEKRKSTGNAERGSFKSLPEVGPTNFFIENGVIKKEELIKKVKNGFYIIDVMGMHTVNTISGDFSVGASGILVENGEFTKPVRGITIAGNILDLLSKIEEKADDIKFYEGFGSPTFLVKEIALSGK